ncbi:MAG: ComEC/Rec2 family competence protein [Actinomycetota bacterium]
MTGPTAAVVAAAAWVGALVGSWVGFGSLSLTWVAVGLAVVLVVGLVVALVVSGSTRGQSTPRHAALEGAARRMRWTMVAAVITALVAGIGGASRAVSIVDGTLADRVTGDPTGAASAMAVELDVVMAGDPPPGASGGRWARAQLRALSAPGAPPAGSRERVVLRSGAPTPPMGTPTRVSGLASPIDGDAAAWFARQGAAVEVRVVDLQGTGTPPGWLAATTWLRERLRTVASAALDEARASLLTGLVTGDVRGQPAALADAVDAAGLSHLVAVSGSNVAMVVGGVLGACLLIGLGRRVGWGASLVTVWWFVVLVRAEPSVLRAALMASLVLVAALLGRLRDTGHLLSVAVLLAVLLDPLLAGRIGFVLSVAATVGVLVVTPRVRRILPGPEGLRTVLAATIGAQVAVAPVLLLVGGHVGVSALLANVVAVPAAAVGSVIGVGAALVATFAPGAAVLFGWLAGLPLAVVVWAAETFAGPVGQQVDRAAPWVLGPALLGWLVVVAVRTGMVGRRTAGGASGAVATVAIVAVVVLGSPAGTLGEGVVLVALDVGQGDAVLVGDGAAGWMLVDGGPDPAALRQALRRHDVDALRLVVLSHPHDDHQRGLDGLFDDIDVGALVVGPLTPSTSEDPDGVVAQAEAAGVAVQLVHEGAGWRFGTTDVQVLSPPAGGIALDANESSVVLGLRVDGGASALLTGDAEAIAQMRLLAAPEVIDIDVIKVPHHGGDTNAEGFLSATTPQVAVISVGEDNPFGHPHPDVLADLVGVDVRRTDLAGDVVVPLHGGP